MSVLSANYTSGTGAHLGESSSLARISTNPKEGSALLVGFPSRSPYQLELKPDADCLVLTDEDTEYEDERDCKDTCRLALGCGRELQW